MLRSLIVALAALALTFTSVIAAPSKPQSCVSTTQGLTPIMDLGIGTYQGYQGGLYADGQNTPPTDYLAAGVAASAAIRAAPRIGLLAVGMSNTDLFFSRFQQIAIDRNPAVTLVNGAQWGVDINGWTSPTSKAWSTADSRIATAGLAPADIRAIWLMEAPSSLPSAFPDGARTTATKLGMVIDAATIRYPNLAQVHVSDLAYEGYTGYEPRHGYENGYSVKWLIADRIAAQKTQPWVGWSAELWADGLTPRSDGLTWLCSDFQNDGLHPTSSGRDKGAQRMLNAYRNNPETGWFR
jgi:hypothetical protein